MSSINPEQKESKFWRSLGQLKGSKSYKSFLHREFQEDASVLEEGVSRRTFLKLAGATVALAGAVGCSFRKPVQKILPYSRKPEAITPGLTTYYATSMALGEDVTGLVVETHEGRPTKVEGNEAHPESLGGTSIYSQASVLNLYDPDRLQYPSRQGNAESLASFDAWINSVVSDLSSKQGKGLVVLSETTMSPTVHRLVGGIRSKYPQAMLYQYSPVNSDSIFRGIELATGVLASPHYQFDQADVIVSFDSDFLGQEVGSVAYANQFAKRRDPESGRMNRLYMVENHFSLTGGKSDHRIRVRYSEVEQVLWRIAAALQERGVVSLSSDVTIAIKKGLSKAVEVDQKIIDAIIDDLKTYKGRSLLVAGSRQPESVSALVTILNSALGNVGKTVVYKALPFTTGGFSNVSHLDAIKSVTASLKSGVVDTLVVLGGDPVLNAPADLGFSEAITHAKHVIHLSLHTNKTSEKAEWVIPQSHYMEAWGDLKSLSGVTSIIQPLVRPLYKSLSDVELLQKLLGQSMTGYQAVRETWAGSLSDSTWKKSLHDGVIAINNESIQSLSIKSEVVASELSKRSHSFDASDIEVVFRPAYSVYDGRFSNNGWLQELPDPMTKLVWDNAALISNGLAKKLRLKTEDLVKISFSGRNVVVPVFVMPGHADNSVSVVFGYGNALGRVSAGSGVDVYPLRGTTSQHVLRRATLVKEKGSYKLATTQEHGSLEGRPIYREDTAVHYKENPEHIKEMEEVPPRAESLFDEIKYDTGYQWGMAIDLSKCTGCNVCIVACQSENNIPIVGKEQALNGREMHWIRVDRYFEGDIEDPVMVEQPMTCLQCENAPCEQVCPVAATVHSKEGLNDMTYNRCIGTRYCADNCPVKVRRFNFFDFHQRNPQSVEKHRTHFFDYVKEPAKTVQLQFNPDVTVRMRGVMEKCTYCVQRISYGKKHASIENRLVVDGEIQSACQQACPTDAIVFGNILDPNSAVSKAKAKQRDYHILEGLYLKPRTSYLASIRNPHPFLEKSHTEKVNHHA